jgi:hypothetical protein
MDFYFLLIETRYWSMASVIDKAVLVGAAMSNFRPFSLTALIVVGPKAPIKVQTLENS